MKRLLHRVAVIVGIAAAIVPALPPRAAWAGPLDLEDDDDKGKDDKPKTDKKDPEPLPPAPLATIKMRSYSLEECLILADRNHPNLWAVHRPTARSIAAAARHLIRL